MFDSKQQLLDLRKDIFLQSSTGYEAKLSQAFVDINKGTVTSDEHVDVKFLNGTLTADKLRIFNSGEVVRFEGNVVMNLTCSVPTTRPPHRLRPSPPLRRRRRDLSPVSQPTRNDLHEDNFSARFRATAFMLALIALPQRRAQGAMSGVPNAMQGFSQNRDQPIQIEAASLEMRDKKKEATFAGNVKVVQGDTTMTSKTLVVFYEFELGAGRARADRRRKAQRPRRCSRQRPGPAAARRSSGWRREAASW